MELLINQVRHEPAIQLPQPRPCRVTSIYHYREWHPHSSLQDFAAVTAILSVLLLERHAGDWWSVQNFLVVLHGSTTVCCCPMMLMSWWTGRLTTIWRMMCTPHVLGRHSMSCFLFSAVTRITSLHCLLFFFSFSTSAMHLLCALAYLYDFQPTIQHIPRNTCDILLVCNAGYMYQYCRSLASESFMDLWRMCAFLLNHEFCLCFSYLSKWESVIGVWICCPLVWYHTVFTGVVMLFLMEFWCNSLPARKVTIQDRTPGKLSQCIHMIVVRWLPGKLEQFVPSKCQRPK